MTKSNIQRSSNFELLRIVSILLILYMHSFAMGGSQTMSDFNHYIGHVIGSVGNIGVTCFILISGYFGSRFKIERFLQIILLTTVYSIFVTLVNNGLTMNMEVLKAMLVIPLYNNWFIACYLLLMVLSPFINKFVEQLEKNDYKKLLLIGLLFLSIIPTCFNSANKTIITGGGKCLIYMLFIYAVGRYIKLYADKIQLSRKKFICMFLICQLLILFFNIILEHLFNKPLCYIFAMDCSPLILISAICIFYLTKSYTFSSHGLNRIASCILSVYLLDGLRLTVNKFVEVENNTGEPTYFLWVTCLVSITFFVAVVIEEIRRLFFGKAEQHILDKLSQLISKCLNTHIKEILSKVMGY